MSLNLNSQNCSGAGSSYRDAVTFDPSWIYGCRTGTSCNGGVAFDNRPSCEVEYAIDNCAFLDSSLNPANLARDVWFKFFPTEKKVTISTLQNISFVYTLQIFKHNSICSNMEQIGVTTTSGPSSGAIISFDSLDISQEYYIRIIGNAHVNSQRTGQFCFCGTTGIGFQPLESEKVFCQISNLQGKPYLNWSTNSIYNSKQIEIERLMINSPNSQFETILTLNDLDLFQISDFIDFNCNNNAVYRLKLTKNDNSIIYSDLLYFVIENQFEVEENNNSIIKLNINICQSISIINFMGQIVFDKKFDSEENIIDISYLSPGVYFLTNKSKSFKFIKY